jgi:RNA polymerase sigma factor (sigma-70 family)
MTQPSHMQDPLELWATEIAQRALGYAITLVRNRQDAEDIVHDCFSRLLAKSDDYNLPRDGAKLLFKSITNACINHTTRRRPESSLYEQELVKRSKVQDPVDHRTAGPLEIAMAHELGRAVELAMNELPVAQRAAVELRSLGHTLVEVAEMLDVSHANARVLVHRARAELAARLSPFIEETLP